MTVLNSRTTPEGTEFFGRRVRIHDTYDSYDRTLMDALRGTTGTVAWSGPDSDGDISVNLDEPLGVDFASRTSAYARSWEFLDEAEATEPVEPEVAKTPSEERLATLIEAVLEGAQSHGYQRHLGELFSKAGLPLPDGKRRLTFRGQRVVSVGEIDGVAECMRSLRGSTDMAGVDVHVVRTIVEATVTVDWPEVGDHVDCTEVTHALAADMSQIPDELLVRVGKSLGYASSTGASVRRFIETQKGMNPSHGLTVSCTYCG